MSLRLTLLILIEYFYSATWYKIILFVGVRREGRGWGGCACVLCCDGAGARNVTGGMRTSRWGKCARRGLVGVSMGLHADHL